MISEKIELLGKGLYTDIPNELTLKAIPTASELDYVGSEDFDATMLDVILPSAVEEKVDFRKLLEIDYQWICRCLRFLNYGPYYTTNAIFCRTCGTVHGEARVDLRSVDCKPLPDGCKNDFVLKKDEFVDFTEDIHLRLLTMTDRLNMKKDKLFFHGNKQNIKYARTCYMITAIGKDKDMTPINAKLTIEEKLSPADQAILFDRVTEITDYGLRAGGSTTCPKCHQPGAAFMALVDDRFLRPTVGDIKAGRNDRSARKVEDTSGSQTTAV